MKQFSLLLKPIFLTFLFIFIGIYSYGPGVTRSFNPVLGGGIGGSQFTAYNPDKNQFFS